MNSENLISSKIAKDLIDLKLSKVIDVRTDTEYNLGHHPDAIHIPAGDIDENSTSNLNKDDIYIVYCNTGQRARKASEKLNALGFKYVYYITKTHLSL
jgi:rhodanese-related sulfurtransferase